MALLPILQILSIADGVNQMRVADATGDYSAQNPGGFGAPNPERFNIQRALIQMGHLDSPSAYVTTEVSFVDLQAGGVVLTPANTPQDGDKFVDGVYDLKYDLTVGIANVTPVGGTSNFLMVNALSVLDGMVGFIIPTYDPTRIFYIDRTKTLNAAGGSIIGTFDPTLIESSAAEGVFENAVKALVSRTGADCLLRDIALWSDDNCKQVNFRDVWERYAMKIAMESKFSQRMFNDAHRLSVKLASYCDETNNSCGCL